MPGDFPHTKYPPVFPALLAPVIAVSGMHLFALRIEVALLAIIGLAVWTLYFRRRLNPLVAYALAALLTLNPYAFGFTARTLSETPFLLFSGLAFIGYAGWETRRSRAALGGMIAAGLLAFFTRTAGVGLLAAIVSAMVLSKELRRARLGPLPAWLLVGAAFAAGVGGWVAYGALHPSPVISYWSELTHAEDGSPLTAADFVARTGANFAFFAQAIPSELLPAMKNWGWSRTVAALVVWPLLGLGGWRCWKDRDRLPLLYAVFGLMVAMLWTPYWDFRFVYPLLPVLLLQGWRGLAWLVGRCGKRALWPRVVIAAAVAMVLGSYVAGVGRMLVARYTPDPYPAHPLNFAGREVNQPVIDWAETAYALDPPLWRDGLGESILAHQLLFAKLFPDAVIAAEDPRTTTFLTGRRAVELPVAEPAAALDYLEGWKVDFVVIDRYALSTQRSMRPLVRSRPDRFTLVLGDPATTAVYQFQRP